MRCFTVRLLAGAHGSTLLLRLAGCWSVRSDQHGAVMNLREIEGREASPGGGVIDSQSVKTTESDETSGFDAGKKVKGRKRHIFADGGYAGDRLRSALCYHGALDHRNHKEVRQGHWFRSLASSIGCRTDFRLAR